MKSRRERRKLERQITKKKKPIVSEDLIFKIKYTLNIDQQRVFKSTLKKDGIFDQLFNPLPKEISELRKKGVTPGKNSIHKEIQWYTEEIIDYSDVLSRYLKLEDDFEIYFLSGNYHSAKSTLQEIREICFSEWFLESNLLLTEYSLGFNPNKETTAHFLNDDNNPLTNLFLKYYSIKVEKELSYFKYDEIITELLRNYSGSAKDYLKYKLNFFALRGFGSLGFFLNIDNSCSIIDKYKSLLTCFQLIMSNEFSKEIKALVVQSCVQLYNKIDDYRLRNIIINNLDFQTFDISQVEGKFNRILDLYSVGNYSHSTRMSKEFLLIESNTLCNYILYCKSTLYGGEEFSNPFPNKSLGFQILNSIYHILAKDKEYYSSIVTLQKIANTLSYSSIGREIYNFIVQESTIESDGINPSILPIYICKYINPLNINFKTSEKNLFVLKNLDSKLNSDTYNFFKSLLLENDLNIVIERNLTTINEYRLYKYICAKLETNSDFGNLKFYLDILTSSDRFTKENKISFNSISLANNLISYFSSEYDYNSIINLITRLNIDNIGLSIKLEFKSILDKILLFDDISIKQNIATPILLSQYNRYVNDNAIWIALDNILQYYNVDYPSRLIDKIKHIDKTMLIYFFHKVCVQNIYDSSIWFENQEELDTERMEILSLLTNLDKDNIEIYFAEISELDRDLLIKKGIKQIDESKIYVDTQGLKNSLYKSLEESLQRSLKLQNLSIDQLDKLDYDESFLVVPYFENIDSIDDLNTEADLKSANIKITSYSRFEHFRDMFIKIRDNFIANNEFGLDTYLSMRIRHGTLIGELRSVFEKYFLITKKDSNSENYIDNSYWKKLDLFDGAENELNEILSKFSQAVDTLSNHLKNEVIQIKTEIKNSEGYFDYSYTEKELHHLFKFKFGSISDTDKFIDEVINELWSRTESNLEKIRSYINNSLKNKIIEELQELSRKVDALKEISKPYELLSNITTCQTELRNELDKISSWFKRTHNKSINDFKIELPIYLTIKTISRLYKSFDDINLDTSINFDDNFDGEYFQHFCYVFQNLIHNILEHSKLNFENLDIKIIVFKDKENGSLNVVFKNNLSSGIDVDSLNNTIDSTISKMNLSSPIGDKIRGESGTGYLKIQKTIRYDLKCKDYDINIEKVSEDLLFITHIIIRDKHLFI